MCVCVLHCRMNHVIFSEIHMYQQSVFILIFNSLYCVQTCLLHLLPVLSSFRLFQAQCLWRQDFTSVANVQEREAFSIPVWPKTCPGPCQIFNHHTKRSTNWIKNPFNRIPPTQFFFSFSSTVTLSPPLASTPLLGWRQRGTRRTKSKGPMGFQKEVGSLRGGPIDF